ncbi:MAG: tetratricopeptide repeat protein, partial [Bryobacteraceae bacterium]
MIATLLLLSIMQVSPELKQRVDAGLKAKAAGDLDTAVHEFRRVAELAPQLARCVNLGAVYLQKKSYSDAIPPLTKALKIDGNLPGAHTMLGTALLAQGFAAASLPHLEKGQAEDLLGIALLELDRPREALDQLESALEKRPDDTDLLYFLSQVHERLSKHLFVRLQQAGADNARLHQRTGEALALMEKRELAETQFRSALAQRPDLRGVHYSIGELHLASGDYEKAEDEFRAEAQLVPGSAAAA